MIVWEIISITANLVVIAFFIDWIWDNVKFAIKLKKKKK